MLMISRTIKQKISKQKFFRNSNKLGPYKRILVPFFQFPNFLTRDLIL